MENYIYGDDILKFILPNNIGIKSAELIAIQLLIIDQSKTTLFSPITGMLSHLSSIEI